MATKTLTWDAIAPALLPNVSFLKALKRQKTVGGAFLSTGFTPANNLPATATTTVANGIVDNTVWEFKIETTCLAGGPSTSITKEGISFACVSPTETHTDSTATGTVSGLPVDITKVRFTLFDSTGTTVLQGPFDQVTSGGFATNNFTSLTASTGYVIKVQLFAVVDGTEVMSTLTGCQVAFTTNAPLACPMITNLVVS